jgi:hypothetical protein
VGFEYRQGLLRGQGQGAVFVPCTRQGLREAFQGGCFPSLVSDTCNGFESALSITGFGLCTNATRAGIRE